MNRVECVSLSKEVTAIMQFRKFKVFFDKEKRHYIVVNDLGHDITSFKNWDGSVKNKLSMMGNNLRNNSFRDNMRDVTKRRDNEEKDKERITNDCIEDMRRDGDKYGVRNAVSIVVKGD